ncbi:MAG: 3-deoxy-D-manno-octulosonic acid kinase [Gammaproteobacteria bacterium]|jgi:3-deoxy-D-manno-octulosonic acid kinase
MAAAEIRHAGNAVTIHDPARYPDFADEWFDHDWWLAEGARKHDITGRSFVLMLDRGEETWVYRHYHRGGFVSRFVYDTYFWTGEERSRPIREWRLLALLQAHNLPAPAPVAARAVRSGLVYRADILTVLLPDTEPLSSMLGGVWTNRELWSAIGIMLARFHRAGCDHPDLTAHNILVDSRSRPFLVDFDNASVREPGAWQTAGVARFRRSLEKVSMETGTRFDESAWKILLEAYSTGSA